MKSEKRLLNIIENMKKNHSDFARCVFVSEFYINVRKKSYCALHGAWFITVFTLIDGNRIILTSVDKKNVPMIWRRIQPSARLLQKVDRPYVLFFPDTSPLWDIKIKKCVRGVIFKWDSVSVFSNRRSFWTCPSAPVSSLSRTEHGLHIESADYRLWIGCRLWSHEQIQDRIPHR